MDCLELTPQSMQELASLMRKGIKFLIPDANSCIDCEPHIRMSQICNECLYSSYTLICI